MAVAAAYAHPQMSRPPKAHPWLAPRPSRSAAPCSPARRAREAARGKPLAGLDATRIRRAHRMRPRAPRPTTRQRQPAPFGSKRSRQPRSAQRLVKAFRKIRKKQVDKHLQLKQQNHNLNRKKRRDASCSGFSGPAQRRTRTTGGVRVGVSQVAPRGLRVPSRFPPSLVVGSRRPRRPTPLATQGAWPGPGRGGLALLARLGGLIAPSSRPSLGVDGG